MAPVAIAVLDSFSPAQLQSRTQIVFAPRVCTLVLFTLLAFAICSVGFVLLATQLPQQTTPLRVLSPYTELTPPHALFYTEKRSKIERHFLQSGSKSAKPSALAYYVDARAWKLATPRVVLSVLAPTRASGISRHRCGQG